LKNALTARGNAPEWLVEPKEGHGFFDEGARERIYGRLVKFLQDNTRQGTSASVSH
jgi:dipeptidyl aminopeptidase/acylaminoacyl peptidase